MVWCSKCDGCFSLLNVFFEFILDNKFWVFSSFILYVSLLCVIAILMFGISRLVIFLFMQDREKLSEYECGFEPFDSATRQPFDVHFYVVGLLFLIFDVELSLLFPTAIHIFHAS